MGITSMDNKRQVINYFILYHLLLSFKFEKLYELRQKKRGFLHTIYDINVKTKAQISCAVIAQLIHSFFWGTLLPLSV